jgi:hypothetical protein
MLALLPSPIVRSIAARASTGPRRVLRLERRDLAIEVPQLDVVALGKLRKFLHPILGGLVIASRQIVAVDDVVIRPNDKSSIVRHGTHPHTQKG